MSNMVSPISCESRCASAQSRCSSSSKYARECKPVSRSSRSQDGSPEAAALRALQPLACIAVVADEMRQLALAAAHRLHDALVPEQRAVRAVVAHQHARRARPSGWPRQAQRARPGLDPCPAGSAGWCRAAPRPDSRTCCEKALLTNTTGQSLEVASQITMPSGEPSTTRRQASADQLFMSGAPGIEGQGRRGGHARQQLPGARPLGQGLKRGATRRRRRGRAGAPGAGWRPAAVSQIRAGPVAMTLGRSLQTGSMSQPAARACRARVTMSP